MEESPTSNNNTKKHHQADCERCYAEPPDPISNVDNIQHTSLFFTDGERSIDFVLVWMPVVDAVQEDVNCTKRAIFEDNLVNEGLALERETIEEIHFTKIHTPIEVLRRYSEILKLRLPMREVSLNGAQNCFCFHTSTISYFTPKMIFFFSHCV